MTLKYSKTFAKQLEKAPQSIQDAFCERLTMFLMSPFDPKLNNHALKGKFLGCRSMNITGDWRAIFVITKENDLLEFVLLGTHSNLYG